MGAQPHYNITHLHVLRQKVKHKTSSYSIKEVLIYHTECTEYCISLQIEKNWRFQLLDICPIFLTNELLEMNNIFSE